MPEPMAYPAPRRIPGRSRPALAGCLGVLVGIVSALADFQGATHLVEIDEGTMKYSQTPATGPVARLQAELEAGRASLRRDDRLGYLPGLLEALAVPASSQMLVFSKTSLQRERISPSNPRAVFFNDDVYVGYIPGAPLLEISEADPQLGGVFYTLEQDPDRKPRLVRVDNCLECHASARTLGVPGHLVRSFETDEGGIVDLLSGTGSVDHRTPLADRWGGWYVTGFHGGQAHRGNLFGRDAFTRHKTEPNFAGNRADLKNAFDASRFPRADSDVVTLMVFEHQAHLHNLLTRVHYMARQHLAAYGHINYLKSPVEAVLRYLLFTEETPLTEPIRPASGDFTREFVAAGPKDSHGRSLRDLDLQTRLFRHPCSFLIYSPAFRDLPMPLRERLMVRLGEILDGTDTSEAYARLTAADRRAIREILDETLPWAPDSWRGGAGE